MRMAPVASVSKTNFGSSSRNISILGARSNPWTPWQEAQFWAKTAAPSTGWACREGSQNAKQIAHKEARIQLFKDKNGLLRRLPSRDSTNCPILSR